MVLGEELETKKVELVTAYMRLSATTDIIEKYGEGGAAAATIEKSEEENSKEALPINHDLIPNSHPIDKIPPPLANVGLSPSCPIDEIPPPTTNIDSESDDSQFMPDDQDS